MRALRAGGTTGEASLAGVLLGGALLTKNEGLALAGILAAALGLALVLGRLSRASVGGVRWPLATIAAHSDCEKETRRARENRALADPSGLSRMPQAAFLLRPSAAARLGLALALAGLVALPWFAVRGAVPSIDEGYPSMFTRENLASALAGGRPADIAAAFWQSFTNCARWGFLWIAFAFGLAALLLRRGLAELDALAAGLAALLALTLYFTVLLVSPWSLELLFATLIPDRLLVHVAPLAIWCVCAAGWPEREVA